MIILALGSISKKDRQYSVVNCCFLFQREMNHVGVMLSKLPKLLWFSTGDPQTHYNARYSGRCHHFYGLLNNEKYQTLSDLLVGPLLFSALKQQKVNYVYLLPKNCFIRKLIVSWESSTYSLKRTDGKLLLLKISKSPKKSKSCNCSSVGCLKCVQFQDWLRLHLFPNQWRGEVWHHVTTVALFLDDNKTNDDGNGKENGKKIKCLY